MSPASAAALVLGTNTKHTKEEKSVTRPTIKGCSGLGPKVATKAISPPRIAIHLNSSGKSARKSGRACSIERFLKSKGAFIAD